MRGLWLGWFLGFSLWCASSPAAAQINVESLVEAVKQEGWGAAAKGSLSFFRGNVDLLELRGEGAVRYATTHPAAKEREDFMFRDRVLLYANAGFKDLSQERVVDDGYGHVRYTRMQWLRFGGEVYTQAQYDEIRLLRRRLVWGLGMRAVFLDTKQFGGWLGSGYMYEHERRNIPPEDQPPLGPDPVYMTNHRFANYIALVFEGLEGRFTAVNVVYLQPRFDDFHDLQILEQLGLGFSITDRLSFSSDLIVRYDSQPPRSVKRTDIRLTQGLVVTF